MLDVVGVRPFLLDVFLLDRGILVLSACLLFSFFTQILYFNDTTQRRYPTTLRTTSKQMRSIHLHLESQREKEGKLVKQREKDRRKKRRRKRTEETKQNFLYVNVDTLVVIKAA